jgi:hypothetical protein
MDFYRVQRKGAKDAMRRGRYLYGAPQPLHWKKSVFERVRASRNAVVAFRDGGNIHIDKI